MYFKLKDGSTISGTIDRETEEYYLVDEDTALSDIVVILKKDIDEIYVDSCGGIKPIVIPES